MFGGAPLRIVAADLLARASVRFVLLERALVRGTHNPAIRRRFRLGAVACGYPRILGRQELRVADLGGYRFYVNVGEPLGVQSYFFGEPCTSWFTDRLIRPGDTCIDAGANVGHYTFAFASVVGSTGRVVAVEANPELAALIGRSIELNGFAKFVSVERRALWSRSRETMRFMLSTNPANTGTSSLVDHGVYISPDRSVEVTTITLDDLARERGIDRVRMLKIDVERAEDQVLRGAEGLLSTRRIDYLLVEMYAAGEARAVLERNGYVGYFAETQRGLLLPASSVPADQFGDFLFVSPELAPDFEPERYGARASSS